MTITSCMLQTNFDCCYGFVSFINTSESNVRNQSDSYEVGIEGDVICPRAEIDVTDLIEHNI